MRILLIGKNGQVGWELERSLLPLGEIIAIDYPEIDLASIPSTRNILRRIQPDVIVNAAAYTAVDQAENQPELAFAINGIAPGILAEEAHTLGAVFIHYSTDYVFDGKKGAPYTEEDTPNPVNTYGESKLEGERSVQQVGGAAIILRTSWVYSLRRDCFVTKVMGWARNQRSLRIVADQTGSPSWCRMLAEVTAQMLAGGMSHIRGWGEARKGLYHLAGNGSASRFEWAQAILKFDPRREEHVVEELRPEKSSNFPTPATRPSNTALSCERFTQVFGLIGPPWEVSLRLAMEGDS